MEEAKRVGAALSAAGITWALGGSCVLIAHGLWHQPNTDWDLNTDADPEAVFGALEGMEGHRNLQDNPVLYATEARWKDERAKIDLMIRFAVRTETGIVYLPTIVSMTWQGMPVGSPEVWAVAYRLIDRPAKADLLSGYLLTRGADPHIKAALLAQPLPLMVRDEVEAWPDREGELQ